jgi:glycosyltransferase involved in cell wall biosynthesis
MAVLEGMAYGLPVIASSVGSIPEVVCDGQEGFLIAPGDVAALADRMVRIAADAGLRRSMGGAARRRIEQSNNIDMMAERVLKVYRDAIAPESGSGPQNVREDGGPRTDNVLVHAGDPETDARRGLRARD